MRGHAHPLALLRPVQALRVQAGSLRRGNSVSGLEVCVPLELRPVFSGGPHLRSCRDCSCFPCESSLHKRAPRGQSTNEVRLIHIQVRVMGSGCSILTAVVTKQLEKIITGSNNQSPREEDTTTCIHRHKVRLSVTTQNVVAYSGSLARDQSCMLRCVTIEPCDLIQPPTDQFLRCFVTGEAPCRT